MSTSEDARRKQKQKNRRDPTDFARSITCPSTQLIFHLSVDHQSANLLLDGAPCNLIALEPLCYQGSNFLWATPHPILSPIAHRSSYPMPILSTSTPTRVLGPLGAPFHGAPHPQRSFCR
uniref:HDC16223 n=1 Tax=Drosophila melanogaster TaxID=7227 RepID=Q6IJ07_DROME|nr:TPA_inf: HDC16223 [Drosophila melanogaster]